MIYLQHFEKKNLQKIKFSIKIGDYIKLGFLFKEGDKKRIQFFEGIVISIRAKAPSEKKITLRKPGTYGLERTFSWNSPQIQTLKILKSHKFNRSKLFYLRKRIGKAAFGIKS
uniref:Ribosomal protein L19 n=1 Tax=Flabellia petiolata TaxID=189428 RepID=A0A386AX27_9CHLO|nr:ribosomal protein L19 [Flabellia petiolata]